MLAALLVASADAANSGPKNLKTVRACFNKNTIAISDALNSASPTLKDAIYQKVSLKLKAYRVPILEDCILTKYILYVQVDALRTPTDQWVYGVELDIFDQLTYPGVASIWNSGSIGITSFTGTSLVDRFATSVSNEIDNLAADYATANPLTP